MKRQTILAPIIGLSLLLTLGMFRWQVGATASVPSFPSCGSQTQPGDRAHYDYGWHQIVGESGLREGSDDVYSLSDGNVFQCYCPVTGNAGIQTDWWKAAGLSQEDVDYYKANGWLYEVNGSQWNLDDSPYLARNSASSCGVEEQPTPTPTPTEDPGQEVTPTPTPTPTVVPAVGGVSDSRPGPAGPPHCPDPRLKAPVLMSVTKSGNDSVDLVWLAVQDADYYVISYGLESGQAIYGVPNTGNVTSFRIGGLDLSKKYYFTVMAQNGCMPGEVSNELSYPNQVGRVLGLASTSGNSLGWITGIVSGLMLMSAGWLSTKKNGWV